MIIYILTKIDFYHHIFIFCGSYQKYPNLQFIIIMMTTVLLPWKSQRRMVLINLVWTALIAVTIYWTILVLRYKRTYDEFQQTDCNITDMSYPTERPDENMSNWVRDNCHDGICGAIPCIKLYDMSRSNKMIIKFYTGATSTNHNFKQVDNECTWTLPDYNVCCEPFDTIIAYLNNLYESTYQKNQVCYYKNVENPQIYLDIGQYNYVALAFLCICLIVPMTVSTIGWNIVSYYCKTPRAFFIYDFVMWALLFRNGYHYLAHSLYHKCCMRKYYYYANPLFIDDGINIVYCTDYGSIKLSDAVNTTIDAERVVIDPVDSGKIYEA